MRIVSLDPARSGYTGLAMILPPRECDPVPRLADWARVRIPPGAAPQEIYARIWSGLEGWLRPEPLALVVERPPPTAKKDTNHGPQARIGDAQGLVGGMIMGAWLQAGIGPVLPRMAPANVPGGWRHEMIVMAARNGLLLAPPKHREAKFSMSPKLKGERGKPERLDGGGWSLPYLGCDHALRLESFTELVAAPAQCAECRTAPTARQRAQVIREGWKMNACRFVERFWPDTYEEVVAAASARAKTVTEPHRMQGVSDVCDAACMGAAAYSINHEDWDT